MKSENLISRVKSILLDPRRTWPVIGDEAATVAGLYKNYIMILAALPALFTFIKTVVFGSTGFFGFLIGLFTMVLAYVISLALVYVVALIINALAPTFGGQKNQVQALKVIAYAYTAAWVAGIATIVPWLGFLIGLLGGIYSIYLLYLGLPHTMKNPPEKSLGYTVVIALITLVLAIVIGVVMAGISRLGMLAGGAAGSRVTSSSTYGEDSQLGKLAALGEQMKAAGEQMEASQARSRANDRNSANGSKASRGSDDTDAQSAEEALGALFGGKDGKPLESLEPEQLKEFLPASVASLSRTSISAKRDSGMGMQVTNASADYANEDRSQRITIKVTDTPMLVKMGALRGLVSSESSSETEDGYEKTYSRNGRHYEEEWNSRNARGKYQVSIGDRFTVSAEGTAARFEDIKAAAESVDLAKLDSLAKASAKQ